MLSDILSEGGGAEMDTSRDNEEKRKAELSFQEAMRQIEEDSARRNKWYRRLARLAMRWFGEPIFMILKMACFVLLLIIIVLILPAITGNRIDWWRLQ